MTSVTVRLDDNVKKGATAVVKSHGFDLTTAFKMFTAYINRTKTVPIKFENEKNIVEVDKKTGHTILPAELDFKEDDGLYDHMVTKEFLK
jgi:addiction module RelB/DinJ family antitoxin